jgi:hypothetical protein
VPGAARRVQQPELPVLRIRTRRARQLCGGLWSYYLPLRCLSRIPTKYICILME